MGKNSVVCGCVGVFVCVVRGVCWRFLGWHIVRVDYRGRALCHYIGGVLEKERRGGASLFCWLFVGASGSEGGAEILAEYKRGRGSEWGRSFFVRFLFGFTGVAIMGATKKTKKVYKKC